MILASWLVTFANAAFAQDTAQQVSRTGSFELPCAADTSFPLFSPEGERDWVKGWSPTPVFPERIEFTRDTVFREGSASEEADAPAKLLDRTLKPLFKPELPFEK